MDNVGKIVDEHGLTFDEEIYYANHALIDICNGCGNYFPIQNHHDGSNYLTWNGSQLLCCKCYGPYYNPKNKKI